MDLGGRQALAEAVTVGDPVVLRVSRWTGHVVAVRTVDSYHRLWLGLWTLVGLSLAVPVVVSGLTWARTIWSARPVVATVAAAAMPALVVGLAVARGPETDRTGRLPADHGSAGYDLATAGAAVAPGTATRVGDFVLTVVGPAARTVPAGAPAWLRDFHVVQLPVRVAGVGARSTGYGQLQLIGTGRGTAKVVRAPACGGVPDAFGGDVPAGGEARTGPACFVVPADFVARFLLVRTLGEPDALLALPES